MISIGQFEELVDASTDEALRRVVSIIIKDAIETEEQFSKNIARFRDFCNDFDVGQREQERYTPKNSIFVDSPPLAAQKN